MAKPPPDPPCPHAHLHTPAPRAYAAWHVWAEEMGRTHTQHRCTGCGLYQIWARRPDAPDLPPIEYRLLHKECQCRDGETLGCDCRWCRRNLRVLDRIPTAARRDEGPASAGGDLPGALKATPPSRYGGIDKERPRPEGSNE